MFASEPAAEEARASPTEAGRPPTHVETPACGRPYEAQDRSRIHDTANQLLIDQGNDAVLSPTVFPVDEYVWLGGRPVMLVRSKLSTSWVRQTDSTGDCTRNADPAACGFYFPVADVIGKPVLMLDASRRVSGAAEYDVFGFPNRVSLDKETAHPYANSSNLTLADFTQAIGGTANPSTQIRVRAIFDLIDTEGPVATPADYVFLKDPDGGVALTSNIGGPHRGQVWSPWVIPSAGRIQVPFISNATGNTYTGVVMAGYEYQRFQTGAQAFWTPLGFPGQYHDAETDLFQNWNRFYEASLGRYMEPEPLTNAPAAIYSSIRAVRPLAAYAYAFSNPLGFLDSDGLQACPPGSSCHGCYFNSSGEVVCGPSAAAAAASAAAQAAAAAAAAGAGAAAGAAAGAQCKADKKTKKECKDHYDKCEGAWWLTIADCQDCKRICEIKGDWPWDKEGGISGIKLCDYRSPPMEFP